MTALLLAALVQTATPGPVATLGPKPLATFQVPAGIPTEAPPVPGAPHVTLRRTLGPLPTAPTEALMYDSGSTNTAGYELHVQRNGSVRIENAGTVRSATLPRDVVRQLFADLRAAGPLDALPAPHCMKSVSFGTTVLVGYRGRRSPDLTCAGDDARMLALARDVTTVARTLGVGAIHGGPRRLQ